MLVLRKHQTGRASPDGIEMQTTRKAVEASLLNLLPIMKALQAFDVFDIRDTELRKFCRSAAKSGIYRAVLYGAVNLS